MKNILWVCFVLVFVNAGFVFGEVKEVSEIQVPENSVLKIGISSFSPCVTMKQKFNKGIEFQEYSGFEVQLFEECAQRLGWKFKYIPIEFKKILSGIQQDEFDICFGVLLKRVSEKK